MWHRRKLVIAVACVALAAAVTAGYSRASSPTSLGATVLPRVAISAVTPSGGGAALDPGDSVHVRATLTNNTTHRLRLDGGAIEGSVSNLPRGCRSSWFELASAGARSILVAGKGGTATVGATLTFTNAPTDQSACVGATPRLTLRPPAIP